MPVGRWLEGGEWVYPFKIRHPFDFHFRNEWILKIFIKVQHDSCQSNAQLKLRTDECVVSMGATMSMSLSVSASASPRWMCVFSGCAVGCQKWLTCTSECGSSCQMNVDRNATKLGAGDEAAAREGGRKGGRSKPAHPASDLHPTLAGGSMHCTL